LNYIYFEYLGSSKKKLQKLALLITHSTQRQRRGCNRTFHVLQYKTQDLGAVITIRLPFTKFNAIL